MSKKAVNAMRQVNRMRWGGESPEL
jgi:hypothetical protein